MYKRPRYLARYALLYRPAADRCSVASIASVCAIDAARSNRQPAHTTRCRCQFHGADLVHDLLHHISLVSCADGWRDDYHRDKALRRRSNTATQQYSDVAIQQDGPTAIQILVPHRPRRPLPNFQIWLDIGSYGTHSPPMMQPHALKK